MSRCPRCCCVGPPGAVRREAITIDALRAIADAPHATGAAFQAIARDAIARAYPPLQVDVRPRSTTSKKGK